MRYRLRPSASITKRNGHPKAPVSFGDDVPTASAELAAQRERTAPPQPPSASRGSAKGAIVTVKAAARSTPYHSSVLEASAHVRDHDENARGTRHVDDERHRTRTPFCADPHASGPREQAAQPPQPQEIPHRYPPVGPANMPMPPRMPENIGSPIAPSTRYPRTAAMHCFGVSTMMANMSANICSVSSTGPNGMATHADTPIDGNRQPDECDRARARRAHRTLLHLACLHAMLPFRSVRTCTISKPRSIVNYGVCIRVTMSAAGAAKGLRTSPAARRSRASSGVPSPR